MRIVRVVVKGVVVGLKRVAEGEERVRVVFRLFGGM